MVRENMDFSVPFEQPILGRGSCQQLFKQRTCKDESRLCFERGSAKMIDEWQEVPSLWDAARNFVDNDGGYDRLILTGSSTPKTKGIMHSGAGRIVSLRMNTMSLF